jgi:hypothetical protein
MATMGLVVVLLAACASVSASDDTEPALALRVDVSRVQLPIVSARSLDDGQVELDPAHGVYAVRIDVDADSVQGGWALSVRAGGAMFPGVDETKLCRELQWKFDHEDRTAYRPLEANDMIVLESPAGGSHQLLLDVRLDVDWGDPPGFYNLPLIFTLAKL